MANVTSRKRRTTSKTAESPRKSYTVKDGDSIDDAAAALGISKDQVRAKNGLRHDMLYSGQRLTS